MTRAQPDRGSPDAIPVAFGATLRRLLGELTKSRLIIAGIVVFAIVNIAMAAVGPLLSGFATDEIFQGVIGSQLSEYATKADAVASLRQQGNDTFADMVSSMDVVPGQGVDFGIVAKLLVAVLLLTAVGSIFAFLQSFLVNRTVLRTAQRIRDDVDAKLNRIPLSYIDAAERGDLLSRVTNDVDNIASSMQQSLNQIVMSALQVAAVLGMMFWISVTLSLISLLTLVIAGVLAGLIAKRAQPHFVDQRTSTGDVNAHIEEAFTGHEIVSSYGRGDEFNERFDKRNEELFESGYRAVFVSGLVMPIVGMLSNVNFVAVAVLGGLRVASGTMSLGEIQAFIQYSRQFNMPLMQMASLISLLQSAVASAERLFELLDAPEQTPDSEQHLTVDPQGKVDFRNVSFHYDDGAQVIDDLSLTVAAGQVVAIVGPTGAGKTTLVNLLMRFYEVSGGAILIDDVDITDMRRDDLRTHIGMVLQDAWLFHGTIRENIMYGNAVATPEQFAAATEAAYVDRFVHALPKGYDTIIDDEGGGVSAGEKQLITIARAFLAQPTILILDEATSSVDTRTELLVQRATAALRSDRTAFVIAHRLSTIRNADLIVVIEAGRIVEQGSHDELIAKKGAFHRLYQAQFVGAVV